VHRSGPVTYINVGANKGYSLVEFLNLWTDQQIQGRVWRRSIFRQVQQMTRKKNHYLPFACGNCDDCKRPVPPAHNRRGGFVHAIEMAAANHALLSAVVASQGLSNIVRVHHLAASNASKRVLTARAKVGDERTGLHDASDKYCKHHTCDQKLRAVSLDDFFSEQRLVAAYQVSIDTEGHDALVLEGMRGILAARRVAIVEFEVSDKGYWTPYRRMPLYAERRWVNGTVGWLADAGYSCFWQTAEGLIPASGGCWRRQFELRKWSNMVCAHEAAVVRALSLLASREYACRQRSGRARVEVCAAQGEPRAV
jgi:FkbM family methyltransferase